MRDGRIVSPVESCPGVSDNVHTSWIQNAVYKPSHEIIEFFRQLVYNPLPQAGLVGIAELSSKPLIIYNFTT